MNLVTDASTPAQLDQVRELMRAFVAWHRERHVEDMHLIDAYFDEAAFESELVSLPGVYATPRGALLLAIHDSQPAGCVALKDLGGGYCEMKRMFVYPRLHGKGIGRALARESIERARRARYRAMRLDTSIRQAEAIGLYRRLGFAQIEPYYELPAHLRSWLVFMELEL